MKLREIAMLTEGALSAIFHGDSCFENCHLSLEADTKMIYLWNEFEQHIKAKLAERLGLEEPIHKVITPSEEIQKMEWSSPNATEDYDEQDLVAGGHEFINRDLGLESNRDDG